MKYRFIMLFAITVVVTSTTALQADWASFSNQWKLDYARNRCWPSPFVELDRDSVRNYYHQMTMAGIRLQNTLGENHFHPESHQITRGGEMKVRQILMGSEGRRAVFVLRGLTEDQTEARLQSTRDAVFRLVGDADATEFYVTGNEPIPRPADYIDDIYRSERSSIPAPRLPAAVAP
ncbi:MAG: hypothetical protein WD045_16690 [Pirellulaceae bacterium]